VADLLGISEVTVRTTRSRALARLRERLTAMETDDPRPIAPTGVTRITTRAVPAGSAGYLSLTGSSPRPPADPAAPPRISA
jgi:hypothetical protein